MHEGGKSAVHPPKRSTRRSEGRGWRCCAGSLRITATGRNVCAERPRNYRARGVFRKIAFEISPHLHGPKGLACFRCCFPGTAPLLTAGRVPTSQKRICLIPLRLRDKLAFRAASTRDAVPKRHDARPIQGTTQAQSPKNGARFGPRPALLPPQERRQPGTSSGARFCARRRLHRVVVFQVSIQAGPADP